MYASPLAASLFNLKNFDVSEWATLAPYLAFVTSTPEPISVRFPEDEEDSEDRSNCQFSLAHGAKILLNTATLRLKRDHRYGLCSENGTGKSTAMRAITNWLLSHLRMKSGPSMSSTELTGEEDTSVLTFIPSHKRILANEAEILETLTSVSFADERQKQVIGSLSLSGSWKMKLDLARAVLFKADLLYVMISIFI
ncbi:hypothetical protein C8R41DRAFT_925697 [Lentinula lateritia]|uniref:ABC transporter domain-containing protein n=1 Tax=Lentinula lateritia TaxID=40482 RepID=A0ABQ8V3M0_9AGAR|nr:hypothetical protein C8R41DRAFT_925697 [Lentinula lateritia]